MRTPQPPQQLRAKRTRRQLLAAAQRVFAQRGYLGATIDDVAEAAGCSKGAYYFHFASKEEVLLALIDEWTTSREEYLAEAVSGAPADDALVHLLEALFSTDTSDGALMLEFWAQAARNPRVRRRLARAEHAWRGRLIDALQRVKRAGALALNVTPEEGADVAMALYRGFVTQGSVRRNGHASARARANAAAALLVGQRSLRATG